MLSWFLNPWMLAGGLAVASPILIHLLNKRRFKIVDWAAMDFLFEADKKNRRRVQLENFILLALRCLAMLLIAMMLARPFLPSSLTNLMQQSQPLERVLIIDDSLSQSVRRDSVTSFEATLASVKELLAGFAESDKTEDWLTVFVSSQPTEPLLANEPLTRNTLATLSRTIEDLTCTDGAADYSKLLDTTRRYMSGQREAGGRAVYLFSDMRRKDWLAATDADAASAPNRLLNEIADASEGCFVIDTGGANDNNLAIVGVRPGSQQVAGKVVPFTVTVANFGAVTVEQVRILLQVDEGQPDYETLPILGPGERQDVTFRHVFPDRSDAPDLLMDQAAGAPLSSVTNYRIKAEIDRQSFGEAELAADQLLADSTSIYAARVTNSISVLLVDGDPSAVSERSETHYLKSLEVAGTGLSMTVVAATELETVSLSDYQVIFLCNVDEASPDRLNSLQLWVREGGALVLMPGNRVRAATFNDAFYQNGEGLAPLKLDSIVGDPTMNQWVNFEIDPQIHPALQLIVDSDATSLSNVDVFTWWTSELDANTIGKSVSVPLRLSDEKNSVAMVDRSLGDGNVIMFTIPGDGDWTMWPSSPTFPPVMIELVDFLVGSRSEQSVVKLGGSINHPVDISAFQNRVALKNPANEKTESIAAPVSTDGTDSNSVLYTVHFDNIDRHGFYDLELTRHSGQTESILFAANPAPAESELKRLTDTDLSGDFFNGQVSLISPETLTDQTVSGGNSEIWTQLLLLLFGVLMAEQFLGWFWGKRR